MVDISPDHLVETLIMRFFFTDVDKSLQKKKAKNKGTSEAFLQYIEWKTKQCLTIPLILLQTSEIIWCFFF